MTRDFDVMMKKNLKKFVWGFMQSVVNFLLNSTGNMILEKKNLSPIGKI